MQSFDISNRKDFMASLLRTDLFDAFEVREILTHTAFKTIVDGRRNAPYFEDIDEDMRKHLSEYLTWGEMRHYVYALIKGTKLPTYFKFVLSTNLEKTAALSLDASTFYLNITFKDNQTTCSTGVAYKNFTMDKSADALWDKKIQDFLFKHQFI